MNLAQELEAMKQVGAALQPLDEDAVARVLRWACDGYKVSVRKSVSAVSSQETGAVSEPHIFKDLPSLFDAANPTTESEKVLVASYWLQEIQGKDSLDSFAVNSQLKHLGYPVGNMTKAFDALKYSTPSLAIQMEKSGKSKQARKKLKITTEGIRKVQAMIQQKAQLINKDESQ